MMSLVRPVVLVMALLTTGRAGIESRPASSGASRIGHATKHESEMVLVPAGEFIMGADDAEVADWIEECQRELPGDAAGACTNLVTSGHFATGTPREVFVSAFQIDRLEVTTAAYRECVRRGPCDMRPLTAADTRYVVDEWPMVNVTWDDADSYCRWRGKRLPTEAEWEKAARGTDGRRWPWGNYDRVDGANRGRVETDAERSPNPADLATVPDDSDGYAELAPPGSLRFGRSPYGALDMAGNVTEWVADWFDDRPLIDKDDVDPTGPATGQLKVVRGGDFFEPGMFARTYFREGEHPGERHITRGFRCAADATDAADAADATDAAGARAAPAGQPSKPANGRR
jgi:formylglycine-generating enzyme required for sulfatase activity